LVATRLLLKSVGKANADATRRSSRASRLRDTQNARCAFGDGVVHALRNDDLIGI
jgi:hypothetical protein